METRDAQDILREALRRFFKDDDEMAEAVLEAVEEIGGYHDDGSFVIMPEEGE